MPTQPKMYVLVRLDLSDSYRMIQGGHALAKYAMGYPSMFSVWNNSTLVYLGVKNLKDLKDWRTKLETNLKKYCCFYEPDLDDQLTSIACFDAGEIFRDLRTA